MAQKVKWTESAWNDLEEIADYIAKNSPYYSATFVREVRDIARSLSCMAKRGRVVPEFECSEIRELLVGSYRLIYKLTKQHVHILGLIH